MVSHIGPKGNKSRCLMSVLFFKKRGSNPIFAHSQRDATPFEKGYGSSLGRKISLVFVFFSFCKQFNPLMKRWIAFSSDFGSGWQRIHDFCKADLVSRTKFRLREGEMNVQNKLTTRPKQEISLSFSFESL